MLGIPVKFLKSKFPVPPEPKRIIVFSFFFPGELLESKRGLRGRVTFLIVSMKGDIR